MKYIVAMESFNKRIDKNIMIIKECHSLGYVDDFSLDVWEKRLLDLKS